MHVGLVDSEVLQYLVHCRESGLAMPRRNTSRQVRRRGIARTCPWRSQNSVASSSSVTATGELSFSIWIATIRQG